jgi:antitoxin component of RelBE/YafQ-DinJ toxin-antitoxin module
MPASLEQLSEEGMLYFKTTLPEDNEETYLTLRFQQKEKKSIETEEITDTIKSNLSY